MRMGWKNRQPTSVCLDYRAADKPSPMPRAQRIFGSQYGLEFGLLCPITETNWITCRYW
jgi:hypothetical protein